MTAKRVALEIGMGTDVRGGDSTKAAVRALTAGMRLDLKGTGVRVGSIDPGMVETEFSSVRFHGDEQRADDSLGRDAGCHERGQFVRPLQQGDRKHARHQREQATGMIEKPGNTRRVVVGDDRE